MDAQTSLAELGKSITTAIGLERRPAILIGDDIDYIQVTRKVRGLLIGIVAIHLVLLFLSLVIPVEEVARARGEFVPVRHTQVIQTAEGGAVEAVLSQNGDHVRRGQVIARFKATNLLRDIQQSNIQMAYLQVNIERLDAFASGRTPNFTPWVASYPDTVLDAQNLYQQQQLELDRIIDQSDRQIDEEQTALAAAQSELPAARESRNAANEVLKRMQDGAARGFVARNRIAQTQEDTAQIERTYTQLAAAPAQHQARIKRLEAERAAAKAKSAADARDQQAQLLTQMNQLKATRAAYSARSQDIDVHSPVAGIVQKISETLAGTVIPPGGTVAEIVPLEGGVLMRAHVSPRDIGFVKLGQNVAVKSDAFDFSRFGTVHGKVTRIAASNTQDAPDQAPYILVEIALDRFYVGTDKSHVLTPGMTGEATILTGRKTIFQYLLKPVFLTLDTAFRER
ncbi:MAG: HlyD family type I secretion periplasmic adaptor subunit [Parvibaculaceae bacterium]|nr:HlyD family type I secretion periplasmic adaptor subunit [Parvibaculaceae bacterium]